jgi:Transposase DDE domain
MEVFSKIATALQFVLNVKADELAKCSGFIKRRRQVTGSNFAKTLLFGWLQNHSPSVEGLARAGFGHELKVSAQGLDQRFTPEAGVFMKSVVEAAAGQIIAAGSAVKLALLDRFTAVTIADCSTVTLPVEFRELWQGVGGDASPAALKLDACLELKAGSLRLGLLPGKHADSRSAAAEAVYAPGSLRLQDLGYFNLRRMKAQAVRGEYWISRLQPGTRVFTRDGKGMDLPACLQVWSRQGVVKHEMAVNVGTEEPLAVRLLLWRLPQEAAARRRAKMLDNARKHCRKPKAENLAWCDWNLLITNVEADKLSHEECFLLYGVRWQIEMLFKLWKSHARVGHSRSEKPHRRLCELYAKLLGVLVQHWIVLTGLWKRPDRSLVKGCQLVREQSARLASSINDFAALVELLKELAERFDYGCSMNPRKKKPNTYQRLEAGQVFY